ncbi:MAG: glycosyltransferase family 2 protein [Clostridiales bacterium]|nr:glycosyltransferase family 2 protein [Clostridiales bacterium]
MIGIVILNYRNWNDTLRCIESISSNPPKEKYQIILIDNASPNMPEYDLDEVVNKYGIIFFGNKENRGYNGGNNVGIAKALELDCDSILITNNDICFFPNSIQTLWEYAREHPDVGIVGPKILDRNGNIQKSNICRRTSMKEKYLVRTRLNAIFRKEYRTYFGLDRDYDSIFEVHAVLGCCFLMTRECAKSVTPLDEHPFLYEEELILGICMEHTRYRTVYNPEAVIEHLHGGSTRMVKAFSFAQNVKSEIYYCKKYLNASNMAVYPLYWYRVVLYLIRCLKYQDFRENWKYFRKITREELEK